MDYDVIVRLDPANRSRVKLQIYNTQVYNTIKSYFTFFSENYMFNPKYKNGLWDGKICLLKYDNTLPIGLVSILTEKISPKYNISIKIEYADVVNYAEDKINDWVTQELKMPYPPRDYQFRAFYDSICRKNNGIISITGTGKSMMIYLISRFLLKIKKRILIVVPRLQLVNQMTKEFAKYGMSAEEISNTVQSIKGGTEKEFSCPIIVSTWQSIFQQEQKHFSSIDALLIDECHQADSKSLIKIVESCYNAQYRIGTSGTVPITNQLKYYSIMGMFGKFTEYITYQEAFDRGYIAPLIMNCICLDYSDADRTQILNNSKNYRYEVDFVNSHFNRNMFIVDLANSLEKNTLLLFNNIESHGKVLYDMFREYTKKKIYYIDGSIKGEKRDVIGENIENETGVILLASYGTFSMGISINNFHNVIFASAFKAEAVTFQSIGRGLRPMDEKLLNVYDIVDMIGTEKKYVNYLVDQFAIRLKMYKERNFKIVRKTEKLS